MKEDEVGVGGMTIESTLLNELRQDVKGMGQILTRIAATFEQFSPTLTRHGADIQELQTHRTRCEEKMETNSKECQAIRGEIAAVRKEAEDRVASNYRLVGVVIAVVGLLTGLVVFAIQHIK